MTKDLVIDEIRIKRVGSDFTAWQTVLDLLHEAFAYQEPLIDPPSSLHRLNANTLAEKAAQEQLIIARSGDDIVGCVFARLMPDRVYVGKMAVSLAVQGRGLGRRLMAAVEEFARERDRLLLELQTRIELIDNHETFRKLGFKKVSESAHEGYARLTSITMQKKL